MVPSGGGAIVNVASTTGFEAVAGLAPYVAAKHGLIGLTKTAAVPVHRLGTPDEVAAAALWLCGDQAAFVTGATLAVDGGLLAGQPPFGASPDG